MRSHGALMNEVGAALQFPSYFGENWSALDECLADMDWWPALSGSAAIVIADADEVLVNDKNDLQVFASILGRAVGEYAVPQHHGESWDRDAIRMRVVLASENPKLTMKRWLSAGAKIEPAT